MPSIYKAIVVVFVFAGVVGINAYAGNADREQALQLEWLELPQSIAGKSPRLFALDNRLLLSWYAGSNAKAYLRFSEFYDNSWKTPKTIASGDNWLLNTADYVQVYPLSENIYLAIWLEIVSRINYDYHFNTSLSLNAGKTWNPASFPQSIYEYGQHGFASAVLQDGLVKLFWIAGVDGDGQLFRADLDLQGNWSKPVLLDDRACTCCHTAITRWKSGIMLAYRDRSDEEIRDIAFIENAENKDNSRILHPDNWRISGCPYNGPAIAANGDRLAIAWFSGAEGNSGTKVAISKIGDPDTWQVIDLDLVESLGYVGLTWLNHDTLVVSSVSAHEGDTEIKLHWLQADNSAEFSMVEFKIPIEAVSGFPTIAALDGAIYLSFYTPQSQRIRIARIK